MPDLASKSFSIRSHLERPADDFDAEVPSSAAFLDASEADRLTLEAGYQDLAGAATFISQVRKGLVDEWELTLAPGVTSTRLRGRDPLTQLLERRVALLFPRAPARPVTDTLASVDEGGGNVATTSMTTLPAGRWRASQIAAAVVDEVNATLPADQQLGLAWQTRDYELRADYAAAGRPIDVLRELAEPWSQAEPSRVDVLIQGLTIMVRNRAAAPQPDFTFAMGDARIMSATLTKRKPKRLGHVVLSGMAVQIEGDGLVGESLADPTTPARLLEIEETPNRTELETRTPTAVHRYRMPDGVLVHSETMVLAANPNGGQQVIARETIDNEWDAVLYDQGQPLRAALQRSQRTLVEGLHPAEKVKHFRALRSEVVTYDYDPMEFLTRITATKREVNLKSQTLELAEMVVKDYTDVGPLLYEVVTSIFRWNAKGGIWTLITRDGATSSGYRPGGPGRSKVTFLPAGETADGQLVKPGQNNSGQRLPITLERTLSEAPDAEDFAYANEHLTREDLEFIMAQLEAASGLWEVECALEGITMPWLKRGVTLQLTNCRDEAGTLMALAPGLPPGHLPPALVLEHTLTYRDAEGVEAGTAMTSQVRALYWRPL